MRRPPSPPAVSLPRKLVLLAPALFHVANAGGFALWPEQYRAHVAGEDRLLEWAQALFYAGAAAAAWRVAREARALDLRALALAFALAAALCALCLLEELSWGQRVFDWSTPERIRRLNRQGETNLHNLAPLHPLQGYAGLAVATLGACGWMLPREVLARGRDFLRILLPGPICCLYFAQYAVYTACVLFQGYVLEQPLLRISHQEVFETPFAAGFLVHGLDRLRELRRARGRSS